MSRRHVFVQYASQLRLITRDRRAEAEVFENGWVQDARYFRRSAAEPEPSGTGWWPRLVRWWQSGPEGGLGVPHLELVLPFDADGADVLGLVDAETPELDGRDDPLGSVRRIEGAVTCLHPRQPGDAVVMRDAWI